MDKSQVQVTGLEYILFYSKGVSQVNYAIGKFTLWPKFLHCRMFWAMINQTQRKCVYFHTLLEPSWKYQTCHCSKEGAGVVA